MKNLIRLLAASFLLAIVATVFGQLPIGTIRKPITTDGTNAFDPPYIVFTNRVGFTKNISLNGFTNSDGGVFHTGDVTIGTNGAGGTFNLNVGLISTKTLMTTTNISAQSGTISTNLGQATGIVRNSDLSVWGATGNVAYASVAGTATNTVNPSPFSVTNNQSVVNFGDVTVSNITMQSGTVNGGNVLNGTQVPTADWVRNKFNNGYNLYATTNTAATGFEGNTFLFSNAIPGYATRSYTGITNNQYLGTVISSQPYFCAGGPDVVNAYMSLDSTNGKSLTIAAETYYTYDKTNLFSEVTSTAYRTITPSTNLYIFAYPRGPQIFTNNGAYFVRRYKAMSVTGNPTLTFHLGTNATVNTPSHSSVNIPQIDMGNVVAAHAGLSHTNTVTSAGTTSSNVVTYSCIDSIYQIGFTAGDSKVYIRSPGSYLITVSALFEASGNGKTLDIWLRQNGASVPRSSTRLKMPNSGISQLAVVPFNVPAAQGDYFEVAWCSRDDATMAMVATTNIFTAPPTPACPSIILTVQQVSAN